MHCLFCTDINYHSHFPAASPGVAHRRFGKTGASTMPQVNALQIANEIHRYLMFINRINTFHIIGRHQYNAKLK